MLLIRSVVFFLAAGALYAQGVIRTIAGTDWFFPNNGEPAVGAALGTPVGLAFDSQGNLYIADPGNSMVFRVNQNGIITVVAGNGIRGYSGDDGPATSASLDGPRWLAVDGQGNLYISVIDRIRKVSPDGVIRRFAGRPGGPSPGDGMPALEVRVSPAGLTFDSQGNLYVVESARIRKIDTKGIITTVVGNGAVGFSGDGGAATAASLSLPRRAAVGPDGSLYIADFGNNRIRRVSPDGIISTFAGNGQQTLSGLGGPATGASFAGPLDVVADAAGNVFFTNAVERLLFQVDSQGIIRSIAGPNISAGEGLTLDNENNFLYVSNVYDRRVRRVARNGDFSTFAGEGSFRVSGEGTPAIESLLFEPRGVALDSAGNLLIADTGSNRIRRLAPDGTLTTIAGNGAYRDPAPGVAANRTTLREPPRVTVDPAGNILIATIAAVYRLGPEGTLSRIAGGKLGYGGDGGPATQASLSFSLGLATDQAGNLYIADGQNNRVRRVGLDGIITTVAGNGTTVSSGDGGQAVNAGVPGPSGVAVDSAGNLYIAENGRIRRVSTSGVITTVSNSGGADIAVDAAGNLYLAGGNRVSVLSPTGAVRTTIGTGEQGFRGDGGPASAAALNGSNGVAVDAAGRIYIADTFNHRIRAVDIVRPTFQLSTAALSFSARSNGLPPPSQSLDVTSSTVGLPLTVSASTASGGAWLAATPATGATPARVRVNVNPAGLAAGNYQGTVTVTAPDANPPAQSVTVQLAVEPPAPAVAAVEPASLTFSFLQGANPASQQLRVASVGSGPVVFSATAATVTGGAWLSVTPASGTAAPNTPAALTVTANPQRLAPGTYSGRVTITPAGLVAIEVPITMTVTSTPQRILLSETGLTFTAVAGGGTPPTQSFVVLNGGTGTLNWTATASTLSGGSGWLILSVTSGTSDATSVPSPVEVRVDPTGLVAGEYYGQVEVRGVAANSPQSVLVVLNVLRGDQNPGPVVQPTGLVFTGVAGGPSPGSQTVLVSNLTSRPMSFNSSQVTLDGGNWFLRAPPNGSVRPDQPFRILVQPDTTGLAASVYTGVVTLLFEDRSVRTVNLLLVLAPGTGSSRSVQQSAGCQATRLLPVFTSLGQDFNVAAAWPVSIEARIVDDCGAPMTTGIAVTSFSNGDPPLALTSLRDGRWSGTWAPRGVRTAQTSVTLNADAPPALRGAVGITGSLQTNVSPPLVAAGGVVSGASYERQGPLAPGSIIAIFGSRLSEGVSLADRLPLDVRRMGTEVILAGRSLPLYYTSDGQLNAMTPYGLAVNTTHQLIVRRGNALSLPEAVTVAAARPAVFTINGAGTGQGHIYRADPNGSQILADGRNPVKVGDTVVLYGAGLGAVDLPVEAGQEAPRGPPAQTVNAASVMIDGREARVLFAGLVPGFTGLYQVNAAVPEGVTPGEQAPVVLTVAGQSSPTVTIAISR